MSLNMDSSILSSQIKINDADIKEERLSLPPDDMGDEDEQVLEEEQQEEGEEMDLEQDEDNVNDEIDEQEVQEVVEAQEEDLQEEEQQHEEQEEELQTELQEEEQLEHQEDTQPEVSRPRVELMINGVIQKGGLSATTKGGTPRKSPHRGGINTVGRRGDPRMHRAVAARLSNPLLSLEEALRIGGFENEGQEEKVLAQRKNQLSRRLRQMRRKSGVDINCGTKPDSTCDNSPLTTQQQQTGQTPNKAASGQQSSSVAYAYDASSGGIVAVPQQPAMILPRPNGVQHAKQQQSAQGPYLVSGPKPSVVNNGNAAELNLLMVQTFVTRAENTMKQLQDNINHMKNCLNAAIVASASQNFNFLHAGRDMLEGGHQDRKDDKKSAKKKRARSEGGNVEKNKVRKSSDEILGSPPKKLEAMTPLEWNYYTKRKNDIEERFQTMLKRLTVYKNQHGDCLVPQKYPPEPKLGVWVMSMRSQFKKFQRGCGTNTWMEQKHIDELDSMEFAWCGKKQYTPSFQYQQIKTEEASTETNEDEPEIGIDVDAAITAQDENSLSLIQCKKV
mmetsp:Transcript_62164/g.72694  ORF Transcript_62164/g.72694 Transcript_62164/m.72694 type:complete len:559 (+) Transcript_62164:228-1904(+)|eukprot:CAMPEP_0194353562 /NCGR_PEP_ID=MMETSP0174-20130528/1873_1 /TAXON_ID=216777 /ORGANISM="Proboscia alata, Strain PI-D3" /LENGTH=558 /DNA_ID=CAMNT_0039122173 /DNA_START=115 /DNA_END=1791 /DNA_ORIENTATION=+